MTDKLLDRLTAMRSYGSSVTLNWGEDTGIWECAWIRNGERFLGFAEGPLEAVNAAWRSAAAPELK